MENLGWLERDAVVALDQAESVLLEFEVPLVVQLLYKTPIECAHLLLEGARYIQQGLKVDWIRSFAHRQVNLHI